MSDDCVSSSWLELESDPGLFTLLIDDFGVKGVQVEEIYDLSKPLENSIFGFIFLFKWIERRSRRSKGNLLDPHSNYVTDPSTVNKMFFAHQIVPNSCATHALLSILLNCKSNKYLDLGELLTKFRNLCEGLSPENKGIAIGNQPKLAEAHNSYAKPESTNQNSTSVRSGRGSSDYSFASSSATASSSFGTNLNSNQLMSSSAACSAASSSANGSSTSGNEIFHFICFVPINGRLYELDGLKPYPINHGSIIDTTFEPSTTNWTDRFKQIIRQRLNSFNSGQQNHEIRFNLMALVPDKMIISHEQAELMKYNCKILNNSINDFGAKEIHYSKLDKDILNSLNKYEQEIFTSANADMKSKLQKIDITSKEYLNNADELTKSAPRQLRSTRLTNLKEENKNDQQFIAEIAFRYNFDENDDDDEINDKFNGDNVKICETTDLYDLCKQYKIEFVNYLNDCDNNDDLLVANKLKPQLEYDANNISKDSLVFKRKTNLLCLKQIESKLELETEVEENKCNEEIEKRKKYKIDALRRKHIYDEFIVTYLNVLSESGKLIELIQNNGYLSTNGSTINNSSRNSTQAALVNKNGSTSKSIYLHSASKKLKKK